MLPPQIRKFDIVQQFGIDADGSRLREVVLRLQQNREAYKQRINQGVEPADLEELSAVVSAYDAALNALPNLWERARREQLSGQVADSVSQLPDQITVLFALAPKGSAMHLALHRRQKPRLTTPLNLQVQLPG